MTERHVVLLHGLFRTRFSLLRLEFVLKREGYTVINESYPSSQKSIEDHAAELDRRLRERFTGEEDATLNFVTHSLGGIVARAWLANFKPVLPVERMVMLGPPNRGVQLVDKLRGLWLFQKIAGEAGLGLGRDEDGPSDARGRFVPPDEVEIGVIAGGTGKEKGYAAWLEGDNDGVVEVESTGLANARDHILVNHIHTFMMNADESIENILHFLDTGRFMDDAQRVPAALSEAGSE